MKSYKELEQLARCGEALRVDYRVLLEMLNSVLFPVSST